VGSILSIIGIIGEWVADAQIQKYKDNKKEIKQMQKDLELQAQANVNIESEKTENPLKEEGKPQTKENVMDIKNIPETDPNDEFPNIYHEGLWKKSRHPNLFFELVCWVGFAFSGLSEDKISWVGFLGPLFL